MNMQNVIRQSLALFVAAAASGSLAEGAGDQETKPTKPAIHADEPSHLWNRLHDAYFVRPDTGEASLSPDGVDPPLRRDTKNFRLSGPTHEAGIAVLDEFRSTEAAIAMGDTLRRAVLQHDLWTVFDWCALLPADAKYPKKNLANLRSRLARAIVLAPSASRASRASHPLSLVS